MFKELSISNIKEKFKNKELNPVDLANECIFQYKKSNSRYKPWVCFNEDIILTEANNSYKRIMDGKPLRFLEGIPIGIKDIFNSANFPTQMGSPLWKGFTPGNDARVVYNLRDAGGIIAGKTVTAEFAVHALNETKNPHDPDLTPGTSSSGSAVAVALGMVPVSIGTQTAGSIVRPASFCGVYGCKPSFGLIPRTGSLKTTDSLDTVGFFTARPDDLKTVFDVCRVHGPNYPISYAALKDMNRQNKPGDRPWKVAVIKTHTWENAPEYAKQALNNFAENLDSDSNIEIFDVDLPVEMKISHSIHEVIYNKSLSYYFSNEYESYDLVSPVMKNLIEAGLGVSVENYHAALASQNELIALMDDFLKGFDVVISLSTLGEAPLRDNEELPDSALMWTLTHLPVVSAPVFISPDQRPFGLQIVARKYNDLLLFNFIDYLQSVDFLPESCYPNLDL